MAISEHLDLERGTLMEHFHRARQNGEHGHAMFFIDKALQTPEYRPEALIWKGIEAMQRQELHNAFLYLSSAAQTLPGRADVRALAGRSILALQQPELAAKLLTAAWQQMPADPAIRMLLWQARSRTETPDKLRRLIIAHLPDIADAKELSLVLGLLTAQPDAHKEIGVVQFLPESCEIVGWAVNLASPTSPVKVQVESGRDRIEYVAEQPHPLLAQAGISNSHGRLRIRLDNPARTLQIRFSDDKPLIGSPLSNLAVFTPPAELSKKASRQEPIDILVPVFDGYEETLECLNSVLRNRSLNRTAHRLVVLDDATPNPQLRQALQALAAAGEIDHIQHPANLGFIRNVNRGMALNPERDVVWLNADTRVHGDWLDRLRAVAYSASDIASVTPFTNNGELMSFPVSRISQPMPSAEQQAELDRLARETASPAVEIETGCGFCLYIKRAAIDEAGYLDEVHLLRGYGEETDWCLRARSLGWRHMGATNVFVAHQGGISFGEEKSMRVAHNNAILKRRYPNASARYQDFCLRDPLKPSRQALQRARLDQLVAQIANTPAGTDQTLSMKQLNIQSDSSADIPLALTWSHHGTRTVVTLQARLEPLAFSLEYRLPADSEQLSIDLRRLPVDELIYNQLTGCPAEILGLPSQLEKPYRIVCADDELLKPTPLRDWRTFASEAKSVQLPWTALQCRYQVALPDAAITVASLSKTRQPGSPAPSTILIGDELRDADIADQWIALARRITREKLQVKLLTLGDSPWLKPLLATGAVHALPEGLGLDRKDCVLLSGCKGAMSLVVTPGAGWKAHALASALGLPLYAIPGEVAIEAGALPINQLPLSLSRA
jgi:GT2 family glycosyltransferase